MTNRFVGTKVSKKYKFMNLDIDVNKLSVSQVMKVQEAAKELEANPTEEGNIKLLYLVIQQGVPELAELSSEELGECPMDELTKLSNEIMKFSGIGGGNKADPK